MENTNTNTNINIENSQFDTVENTNTENSQFDTVQTTLNVYDELSNEKRATAISLAAHSTASDYSIQNNDENVVDATRVLKLYENDGAAFVTKTVNLFADISKENMTPELKELQSSLLLVAKSCLSIREQSINIGITINDIEKKGTWRQFMGTDVNGIKIKNVESLFTAVFGFSRATFYRYRDIAAICSDISGKRLSVTENLSSSDIATLRSEKPSRSEMMKIEEKFKKGEIPANSSIKDILNDVRKEDKSKASNTRFYTDVSGSVKINISEKGFWCLPPLASERDKIIRSYLFEKKCDLLTTSDFSFDTFLYRTYLLETKSHTFKAYTFIIDDDYSPDNVTTVDLNDSDDNEIEE